MKSAEITKKEGIMKRISFILIACLVGVMNMNVNASDIIDETSEDLHLEEWMTVPFVTSVNSEDMIVEELALESWMTSPFIITPADEAMIDEVMSLENWMTTPFDSANENITIDKVMKLENCETGDCT